MKTHAPIIAYFIALALAGLLLAGALSGAALHCSAGVSHYFSGFSVHGYCIYP